MNSKQYAVLGLGIFGSTVATTLAEYGCEVIAVDQDESCVERVADEVTKAVVANVTDQEELRAIGIEDPQLLPLGYYTSNQQELFFSFRKKLRA